MSYHFKIYDAIMIRNASSSAGIFANISIHKILDEKLGLMLEEKHGE